MAIREQSIVRGIQVHYIGTPTFTVSLDDGLISTIVGPEHVFYRS